MEEFNLLWDRCSNLYKLTDHYEYPKGSGNFSNFRLSRKEDDGGFIVKVSGLPPLGAGPTPLDALKDFYRYLYDALVEKIDTLKAQGNKHLADAVMLQNTLAATWLLPDPLAKT